MADFAKGDLIRWVEKGIIARVTEIPVTDAPDLVEIQAVADGQYAYVYPSDIVDEYEYEREAGHYGLIPKGIKPSTQKSEQ